MSGYADYLSTSIGAGMNRITLCQQVHSVFIPDAICKFDAHPLEISDLRFYEDHFIVMRRKMIMAIDLGQRQVESSLLGIRRKNSHVPEELGPSHLEPSNIVGVIYDAHGIGIGVDDTDLNG